MLGCGPAGSPTIRAAAPEVVAANGTAEITVTLPGRPADEYRTDRTGGAVGILDARVRERLPGLLADPCLDRAAGAYGRTARAPELPLAFSEFVLHWAGCPDPFAAVADVLTVRADDADLLDFLETTLRSLDATHVGVARVPAAPPYAWRWTVFLTDRRFELQPLPTSAPVGAALVLAVRFLDRTDTAVVVTTTPDGVVEEHEAGLSGSHMVASLELSDRPGTQWVEVVAGTEQGPKVVALFPVEVGRPPPVTWSGRPRPDETWISDPSQAEAFALELLQDDRRRFGLSPLASDESLSRIARRHSVEMATTGRVVHVSDTTGTIADRLEAAGYPVLFAAENIARSSAVADAQEGLMRSPGHRAAILGTKASHVGIGVTSRSVPGTGTVYFMTQVFARPDPRLRD